MDTIRIEKGPVLMVAHRGVSGLECENSCAAFVAAGNRSYWGIETDVHVTADGKYVVIHDDRTGRVSAEDICVEDSTYEELCRLSLYSDVARKEATRRDLVIPTLADYIRICKRYDKVAVLELKNTMLPEHVAGIVEQVRQLEHLDKTVFISFSYENMVELRRLLPNQPLQYLIGRWTDQLPEMLSAYDLDLDIGYWELTAQQVEKIHAIGRKVNCWTVDDPKAAQALIAMGVDMITSNILE